MSDISYFQKYSQRENHITNNSLLMMRHLYRNSPTRMESFIKSVLDDDQIEIGLTFQQQIRASNSIPDALISQSALNIFIEAKADGLLYLDQIQRHVDSITAQNIEKESCIILGLTKRLPADKDLTDIRNACKTNGIKFTAVTYSELIANLYALCPEYETDLYEIVQDYESFLHSVDMIDNPFQMVVFPCGTSWNENIEYGIYYEQGTKPSKANSPFIGIYRDKKITHIGKIKGSAICSLKNGNLIIQGAKPESGSLDEKDLATIQEVIEKTPYYDLGKSSERYYLIEDLQEVNLIKTSSGGLRGHRYFDLQAFSEYDLRGLSMEEIVKNISGKTFS